MVDELYENFLSYSSPNSRYQFSEQVNYRTYKPRISFTKHAVADLKTVIQ